MSEVVDARHLGVARDRHAPEQIRRLERASDEFRRWATDALRTHRFADQRDRNIWAWHAAGKSSRAIAARFGYSRWRVAERVTELHDEIRAAQRHAAEEPANVPHLIEECDPVFLLQLAVALEQRA